VDEPNIDDDPFMQEQMETLRSGSPILRAGGKSLQEVQQELEAYFPLDQLEFKPSRFFAEGATAVLTYVTARAIMRRLDDVVGPGNWKDSYERWGSDGVKCSLSIRVYSASKFGVTSTDAQGGDWVAKEDVADETDIEATKGGVSSALKRAAVKWGIGRYLYDFPDIVIWANEGWSEKGQNGKWRMKRDWKEKWSPPSSIDRFLPGLVRQQGQVPQGSESPPAATQAPAASEPEGGGKMRYQLGEPHWLGRNVPGEKWKEKGYVWGEMLRCELGSGGRWEWLWYQAFKTSKNSPNTRSKCRMILTKRVMDKWPVEEEIMSFGNLEKGLSLQVEGDA
jgi:hypothetical protein